MGRKLKVTTIVPDHTGAGFVIYGPEDDVPAEHAKLIDDAHFEGGDGDESAEDSESTGEFNPSDHTVGEVQAYLKDASDDEAARVIDAEKAGQARKGIIGD